MGPVCSSVSLLTVLLVRIAIGFGCVGGMCTVVQGGVDLLGSECAMVVGHGWTSMGGEIWLGGGGFTKEYLAQVLNGFQFVWGGFLYTCNGIGEVRCCVKDPVGGCDGRYRYGVVTETKCVGEALAPHVCHDDMNATVVLCRVGKVPIFSCMVSPGFASMRLHVHEHLCPKWCHGWGVEGE